MRQNPIKARYSENVPAAQPAAVPSIKSEALLGGTKEIFIIHGKEQYRLRLTANGKLILTK
ncbi:MAG: hemin uptake protein HemP [Rhodospirillales bacterium]